MRYIKLSFVFIIFLFLSGCGGMGPSFSTPVLLQEAKIHADKDANDGDATAVDILILYDKDLLDRLTNMKSADYFAQADELEENNPNTLERFHFEVVAGSTIAEEIKPKSNRGVGALIFADISAPGTHRYRVGPATIVGIKLLHGSMEVDETESFKVTSILSKGTSWLF